MKVKFVKNNSLIKFNLTKIANNKLLIFWHLFAGIIFLATIMNSGMRGLTDLQLQILQSTFFADDIIAVYLFISIIIYISVIPQAVKGIIGNDNIHFLISLKYSRKEIFLSLVHSNIIQVFAFYLAFVIVLLPVAIYFDSINFLNAVILSVIPLLMITLICTLITALIDNLSYSIAIILIYFFFYIYFFQFN